jgi:hypothetical protein
MMIGRLLAVYETKTTDREIGSIRPFIAASRIGSRARISQFPVTIGAARHWKVKRAIASERGKSQRRDWTQAQRQARPDGQTRREKRFRRFFQDSKDRSFRRQSSLENTVVFSYFKEFRLTN